MQYDEIEQFYEDDGRDEIWELDTYNQILSSIEFDEDFISKHKNEYIGDWYKDREISEKNNIFDEYVIFSENIIKTLD